jgi:hypothetical protein
MYTDTRSTQPCLAWWGPYGALNDDMCSSPAEMHRMRLDMQAGEKERLRLDGRVQAKEREIGSLMNKVGEPLAGRRWNRSFNMVANEPRDVGEGRSGSQRNLARSR